MVGTFSSHADQHHLDLRNCDSKSLDRLLDELGAGGSGGRLSLARAIHGASGGSSGGDRGYPSP